MTDHIIIVNKPEEDEVYEEIVSKGEIESEIEGIRVLLTLSSKVRGRTFKLFRVSSNGETLLVMEIETGKINVGKVAKCRQYLMK